MTGYLPPEWAPQAATLLVWPRADGDWGNGLAAAREVHARMSSALATCQPVLLLAPDREARTDIQQQTTLAGRSNIHLVDCPADDIWIRDYGPLTVIRNGRRVALDFRFDGWGGKFPARRDDDATRRLALDGWLGDVTHQAETLVLEGGSLEVDGRGALLTTRRCLLGENRNSGTDQATFEALFADRFGVDRVHWLDHGELIGDDTDGHIDTLARFVPGNGIVYQGCDDPADAHYPSLQAMARELAALRDASGQPYVLHELPLPAPIHDPDDGHRLPAGYANFLIANGCVLMPTFDDPADAVARAVLAAALPGRRIIPVDCRALIRQNGGIHCAAMQLPAAPDHD